jgi:hypothetical protein
MPEHDDYSLMNLPEGLRGQFVEVGRRLRRVETTAAWCGLAASLLFSWLLIFISDRLWDTPIWLRAFFFLCGVGGAAAAAFHWARHWVWHRRDLRALATLVQKKYRRLGDRLLGIVELANEQKHSANFSPALYQAAIEQVAGEAQKFDFLQSVNVRDAKKFGWMAGGLAAGLVALCAALPQAGWNSFLRWVEPTANIGRYTLVALDGFPAELIVPHGEPFEISGTVRYLSFWKPSRVLGRLGLQPKTEAAVQSNKIRLQVPGQLEKGILEVRVGDASARIQILPNHRPSLQQLSAVVHLPDYLEYPDQTEAVQNGSLRALEGSRLSFRGTVSRPLASARMQRPEADAAALKIKDRDFLSDAAPSASGEFTFSWRDQLGLTNAAPWRLSVQPQKDAPPAPDLPDFPRATAMLVTDVLHIHAAAEDDYGVRDLGLEWDVVSDGPQKESMTTEAKIQTASPWQKKAEKTFLWSPSLFGIPADSSVELQAFARDYFPERERARTAVYNIRVLSAEEHAEMVRLELEALMAQIEDVARLQEKIVADTKGVKDAGNDMPDALQASHLNQSKEDQLQNAQKLQDLTKQGQSTVREAMKNSLIPEDTVQKWTQTMQEWQKLSQEKMQEAARSMQAAAKSAQSQPQEPSAPDQQPPSTPSKEQASSPSGQTPPSAQQPSSGAPSKPSSSPSQPSSPPSSGQSSQASQQSDQSRQQDLAEAVKRAEEILDALRKMEQTANKDLDQLQALTLAQRLRKVGDNENGLDGELTTNFADTIGLPAQELPDKFKQINNTFAKEQGAVHDESAALQGEISRFYERTQKTNYGKVSQEMKVSQASDQLDRMGSLIQSNITALTALDLTNWAGRFQQWADDLQPKSEPSQGGSGQSGTGPDLGKLLTALLRMRGREMNLRDQTGLLEAAKPSAPNYKERAAPLAGEQRTLAGVLDQLHHAAPIRALDQPFNQTSAAMSEAQTLLDQPRTDSLTETAEVKVVDNLSDMINLINEQAQKSQSQGSQADQSGNSAEQMAFLTQLMSQGASSSPPPMQSPGGGNTSGGSTDRTGHSVSGDVTGQSAAGRNVNKAAGAIESYPAEFRDALENYFHAVEKP